MKIDELQNNMNLFVSELAEILERGKQLYGNIVQLQFNTHFGYNGTSKKGDYIESDDLKAYYCKTLYRDIDLKNELESELETLKAQTQEKQAELDKLVSKMAGEAYKQKQPRWKRLRREKK